MLEKRLSHFDSDVLKALLYEFASTKNALLIEQKKCRTPEEIAERDGAISVVDVIVLKLQLLLREKNSADFLNK
jgi:hypothetical protein